MPKTDVFADTFATLHGILRPYAAQHLVTIDGPRDYQLYSRTLKDRAGRPLFVAAVQIKKVTARGAARTSRRRRGH